jgi:hypothetical protein
VTRPRKREVDHPGALLLSERDRDRAIAVLRECYADGSLTLEDYSGRLDKVLAGRTHAQLDGAFKGLRRRGGSKRRGHATSVPRGSALRRGVPLAAALVAILALVLAASSQTDEPRFDRSGVVVGTLDPFASVSAADVYIVPLDRPAWYADGAFSLLKLQHELSERGLKTLLTPPLTISRAMYDSTRHQISGDALASALASAYRRHPSAWPATVVGVTSLDMYSPAAPGLRFVFMSSRGYDNAGFAAISTARMRHGILRRGSAGNLEKMAARAAGLYFYRLPRSPGWSLMHEPIRSLSDLERMSEEYGVPRTVLERRKTETRRLTTPF